MSSVDVLQQVSVAFSKGNRKAAWVSLPWGAAIPVATYVQVHALSLEQSLWHQVGTYLAAGGLVYSGLTVFEWVYSTLSDGVTTRRARAGAWLKSAGFVVLSEGTMVAAPQEWLGLAMLALLVAANAIALQCTLVLARKKAKAEARASNPPKSRRKK